MKTVQRLFETASRFCMEAAKGMILLFMVAMSVIIMVQVFSRYVLNSSISWSEEIARYLMIWTALVGASVALRQGSHVAITLLIERLNQKALPWFLLAGKTGIAFFLFVLIKEGIAHGSFFVGQKSPAMEVSMLWPYAGLFIGGIFMFIHLITLMLNDIDLIFRKPSLPSSIPER